MAVEIVATAVVAITPVAMAIAVSETVVAATVTILPLKNVVQIHILITSVDLIKVAAGASGAFAAMRAKNVVHIIY